jgi:hypothetical protein
MDLLNRMWSLSGAVLLAASVLALWVWPKFFGVEVHPIFGWAEAQSGLGWLEPGGRWAVGAVAFAIAVLVLIPRTRLYAAWAGLALSTLFVAAHATPWLGMNIPSYGPLMEALAAGSSAEEIRAMGLPTDMGGHATLALTNALLAAITIGGELSVRGSRRSERKVGLFAASAA